MRKLWLILLFVLVLAAAMILDSIPAHAKPMSSAEQNYIAVMREGDTERVLSDADWLRLGYTACGAVKTAGSPSGGMTLLAVTTEYPLRVLQVVVAVSTEYLCPELGNGNN